MFGVQWDLVLKHLSNKGVSESLLKTDSSTWGNYYNQPFEINRGKYSQASPWNTFIDYTTSISKLNKFIVATAKRAYFEDYHVNPWTGYGPAFLKGPPCGYKEAFTKGLLDWKPDDVCRYPIQYLFEAYKDTKPEMDDLLTTMKMYGLDLTPNRISRILRNPFYAGYFKLDDKFYPHIHEAIIDKKLYNAVQKKLKRGNPIILK